LWWWGFAEWLGDGLPDAGCTSWVALLPDPLAAMAIAAPAATTTTAAVPML
jgi:hypothetical protein